MATTRQPADERLHGLLEIARLAGADPELPTVLGAIARAVSEALAFETVAVNLYRPARDDFEVVAVHGSAAATEALLGTATSRGSWELFLSERFARSGTFAVRHGEVDWEALGEPVFTPELVASSDPDAWHPEDALFVRLDGVDGELLGVISVDEPRSGRWPSDVELEVLATAAGYAAQAIEASQRAVEDARLRRAVESLVSVSARMQESGSPLAILAAVCDGIRVSLGFEKVSAQVLDPERGVFVARAKSGWEPDDDRVDTSLTPDDVRRLVDPGLLRQGCSLLERERALSLTGARGGRYASARNGGGPKAWRRHWLVVPLLDRDHELLGFVWADDPDDRLLPSDARLQTLRMFADQAARALESARSVATLARRNDELAALHETTLELLEQLDAKPMLETIVERARDLVRADDGFLYVPDPDDAECMTVSVAAGPFGQSRDTRIHRGEGISGRVWERRLPLVIDDYSRWEGRVGSLDGIGYTAVAAVPVMNGDRVEGVLGVANRRASSGFTSGELELLERFARLASLALHKGRLHEALVDSRELYRRVVENSAELITLVDPEGRIV